MSKFIKVTYLNDDEKLESYVNVDQILFLRKTNDLDEKYNTTLIVFGDKLTIRAMETKEQIMDLISKAK